MQVPIKPWLEVEDNLIDACIRAIGVVHCLVVVGVDDVGRRTWDNGAYILFVAVAKYADDKFNVFHTTLGKRAVNCGKTVTRLLRNAFCQHSVWIVVSVVVVKELVVVVRVS